MLSNAQQNQNIVLLLPMRNHILMLMQKNLKNRFKKELLRLKENLRLNMQESIRLSLNHYKITVKIELKRK